MAADLEMAIVGAGPYGLALAARLRPGSATVFGPVAETWLAMQPDMELRARWREMTLASAGDPGSLAEWSEAERRPAHEPMTVEDFVDYTSWFSHTYVSSHVPEKVESVESTRGGFRVETGTATVTARALALAVGITPFSDIPHGFRDVDDERILTGPRVREHATFSGLRVVVVGGGQSAIDVAIRLAAAGAIVTLLVRDRIHWFAAHEPSVVRGRLAEWAFRLAYPAVGYGPPPLNRVVLHPDLFAVAPRRVRAALSHRLLRPGASEELRDSLLAERVTVRESSEVVGVSPGTDDIRLELGDGSSLAADRVVIATGFRFDLDRLQFLSEEIRQTVSVEHGWPVIDRQFRSTNPAISFLGYAAEGRFGPIARFVLGVPFTVGRVASRYGAS